MSKSAELDGSRINLLDDPKLIQQKVKRAKTDAFEGLEFGNPERPEATNLLGIYSLCTGISMVSLLLALPFNAIGHLVDPFCITWGERGPMGMVRGALVPACTV